MAHPISTTQKRKIARPGKRVQKGMGDQRKRTASRAAIAGWRILRGK